MKSAWWQSNRHNPDYSVIIKTGVAFPQGSLRKLKQKGIWSNSHNEKVLKKKKIITPQRGRSVKNWLCGKSEGICLAFYP